MKTEDASQNAKRKRRKNGQFEKGGPGGPGRPKLSQEYREAVKTVADRAIDRLLDIVESPRHKDHVRACEFVIEQAYGKAKVTASIGGIPGAPPIKTETEVDLSDRTSGDLRRMMDELRQAISSQALSEVPANDAPPETSGS